MGVFGPHTQGKCLYKVLVLANVKEQVNTSIFPGEISAPISHIVLHL